MQSLDPRKRIILQAVIMEYVAEGEPVGSELIAQKYELGVRSATVRNELAEMADLGYLEQPHTSAGRIPSDVGYRYFVDNMVKERTPDPAAQDRVIQATDRQDVLKALLLETTKALSRVTHQLVAATMVGDVQLRVRTIVLTALGPARALLVLVMNNGNVENRMLEIPADASLDDIGRVNELLGGLVNENAKSLSKIKTPHLRGKASEDKLIQTVWATLRTVGRELSQCQLVMEGEEYIFAQPEFRRDVKLLEEVLVALENEDVISNSLQMPTGTPILITIGKENSHEGMRALSVLRHVIAVGGEEAGTLAIIGPTRQDYEESIALLKFTADAIGKTLAKVLP